MGEQGIRRIVLASTQGAGGDWARLSPVVKAAVELSKLKVGFADHDGVDRLVRASDADWTLARAVVLSDKAAAGPLRAAETGTERPGPGSTAPTSPDSSWTPPSRAPGYARRRWCGTPEADPTRTPALSRHLSPVMQQLEEHPMPKVIAIFGAGPGLGASVARRFAREGFRVALVARRKDRLDALVEQLAAEGIEAAGCAADLAAPDEIPAVIDAIRERFGRIDVIEYGPVPSGGFTPAAQLDQATLSKGIPLLVLTPLAVVQAVLPEWTERGDGAFLMTTGASAVHPMPYASGVGPLMAAARNWLYSLNGELAASGIYAGTLSIAAFIAGSEAAEAATAAADPQGPALPLVDPDDLAALYWDMYTKRDRVEEVHPDLKVG
jgi:short-subunit dehydrogenase